MPDWEAKRDNVVMVAWERAREFLLDVGIGLDDAGKEDTEKMGEYREVFVACARDDWDAGMSEWAEDACVCDGPPSPSCAVHGPNPGGNP